MPHENHQQLINKHFLPTLQKKKINIHFNLSCDSGQVAHLMPFRYHRLIFNFSYPIFDKMNKKYNLILNSLSNS